MSNTYNVILTETGPKILSITKILANFTSLSRDEIMDGLEELPMTIAEEFTKEKAEELLTELKSIGAQAMLKEVETDETDETKYDLWLTNVGNKSMTVAKAIATINDDSIDTILEAIEDLPYLIAYEVKFKEAMEIKERLEALGASVDIEPNEDEGNAEDIEDNNDDDKRDNTEDNDEPSGDDDEVLLYDIVLTSLGSKPMEVAATFLRQEFDDHYLLLSHLNNDCDDGKHQIRD